MVAFLRLRVTWNNVAAVPIFVGLVTTIIEACVNQDAVFRFNGFGSILGFGRQVLLNYFHQGSRPYREYSRREKSMVN